MRSADCCESVTFPSLDPCSTPPSMTNHSHQPLLFSSSLQLQLLLRKTTHDIIAAPGVHHPIPLHEPSMLLRSTGNPSETLGPPLLPGMENGPEDATNLADLIKIY